MNLLRDQDPQAEGLAETLIGMLLDGINIGKNNYNSSGATAPDLENAAKFRGENKKVVFTSCSSCFHSQHPPVVLDYCIQHLGAMVNELDDAARVGGRGATARPDGGGRQDQAIRWNGALFARGGLMRDEGAEGRDEARPSRLEDSCATRAQKAATKRGPPVMRVFA